MGFLSAIAKKINGHDCEQIVKKTGNEITLSGAAIEVGPVKINIGAFSNKVIELIKATEIAVNLDQAQYLVCKAKNNSTDVEFKIRCERIYLQIILSLTQLSSLFEAIKIDPSSESRKELVEWIKYCGSLNKHAIQTLNPGSTTMGPEDQELELIMKYQGIEEQDMKEALEILSETSKYLTIHQPSQKEYKLPEHIMEDVDQNDAASIRQASEDLDTVYNKIRLMASEADISDIMGVISEKEFENIAKLVTISKESRYPHGENSVSTLRKSEFVFDMLEKAVERNIIKDQGEAVFSNDTKIWEQYLGTNLFAKSKKIWI